MAKITTRFLFHERGDIMVKRSDIYLEMLKHLRGCCFIVIQPLLHVCMQRMRYLNIQAISKCVCCVDLFKSGVLNCTLYWRSAVKFKGEMSMNNTYCLCCQSACADILTLSVS